MHFHWYGIKSKGASVDSISVVRGSGEYARVYDD